MKVFFKSKKFLQILSIVIIIAILCASLAVKNNKTELKSVKSKKELENIYDGSASSPFFRLLAYMSVLPYSALRALDEIYTNGVDWLGDYSNNSTFNETDSNLKQSQSNSQGSLDHPSVQINPNINSSSPEHSNTNIQVENVDEADITKTDGNYIYSISDDKVKITNVTDPSNLKLETTINSDGTYTPEDLILYKNKLVIISASSSNGYYDEQSNINTLVNIYDITSKSKPNLIESFELHEDYNTSRCINGKLLIISSGLLRKNQDEVDTQYLENNKAKQIELKNIRYLNGLKSYVQTLIASYDLNKSDDVKVNSYLFDIKNVYISENNMYLLNETYDYYEEHQFLGLLNIKGILRYFDDNFYDYQKTNIYKFNINDDGTIKYACKTSTDGTTINQFSLDEYNDNLRIALYTSDGSRISVYDKNLKLLGETDKLAKGEEMYSTRFVGNKAYMVTYKQVDPLFVIDLNDPSNPTILGELKIPGYSTYLQPYDDTHIIGIGMQTETSTNKNQDGRVTGSTTIVTGMKMALFDISDVNKPKQISQTIIGNSRTTSAILTNHKALLFDKNKQIIAIPVNNCSENFEISTSDTSTISDIISSYTNYSQDKIVGEGYLVYNINLQEGFKLKGVITHDETNSTSNKRTYYNKKPHLLRGMWIENNLFTISEDMIKVNRLSDLSEISSLRLNKIK